MIGYTLHPEAFDDIGRFPGSRPHATGPDHRPIRFIRVRDYLIAYAPDEKPTCAIAIIHGHRSPRVTAAILRGRE